MVLEQEYSRRLQENSRKVKEYQPRRPRSYCLDRSATRCMAKVGGHKCTCARGHCALPGEGCVSGPEREAEQLQMEYDKRLREMRRTKFEGKPDPALNYHWV